MGEVLNNVLTNRKVPRYSINIKQGKVMLQTCKVCNYQRQNSDLAPDYECPQCGIVYAKADQYLKKKSEQEKIALEANKRDEQIKRREKNKIEQAELERKRKDDARKRIAIKTYVGKQNDANALFQEDSIKMAENNYYPTSQCWSQGQYGCGAFIGAALLCFIFIGIFIFIYMVIVKPAGTLTVTYELREASETKTCLKCAEKIQAAAVVCRYCNYEYG